jgi:hypothetical protein
MPRVEEVAAFTRQLKKKKKVKSVRMKKRKTRLKVENQIVVQDLAQLLLQSAGMRPEASVAERVDLGFNQEVSNV